MSSITYHIYITGQIQGVGFRPFIYRLAKKSEIKGTVKNADDGVHIIINADRPTLKTFIQDIKNNLPYHAHIETIKIEKVSHTTFHKFVIIDSEPIGQKKARITPDLSICKGCISELKDFNNRRSGYAFITCTNCGPRYSILSSIPFDRHGTSMQQYVPCNSCQSEYANPNDVRFYSQTNSCKDCGINIFLYDSQKNQLIIDDPIKFIIDQIYKGKIIAVKGIGGYLLLCDATNANSISRLRNLKKRPTKPFALMYKSIEEISKDALVSDIESECLSSATAPIVLLQIKEKTVHTLALEKIAPGLTTLGIMLPSAPLLYLIADAIPNPLIATSGNSSNTTIIYTDIDSINELSNLSDFILVHDREIRFPQDDSVIQFERNLPIVMRRSRGLSPSYFGALPENVINGVVSLGSDMKATIGISHADQWVVSQYLGDQESYEAQKSYTIVLNNLLGVLQIKPNHILIDKHPSYFTALRGNEWSKTHNIPLYTFQHHEAHFAALLQEQNLIHHTNPILGVIWDGTGYGDDGNIWGGEFFIYNQYRIKRVMHLEYIPILAGDKMTREPRLAALSFSHKANITSDIVSSKFTQKELDYYNKVLINPTNYTSSMGRFFDAVASILQLIDKSTYEGEAAMYLQVAASRSTNYTYRHYTVNIFSTIISTSTIIKELYNDLEKNIPIEDIALKFHYTLVEIIRSVADTIEVKSIAFSGGVFQNSLLIKLIRTHLSQLDLYFHQIISPNDENISFGQLAYFHLQQYQK